MQGDLPPATFPSAEAMQGSVLYHQQHFAGLPEERQATARHGHAANRRAAGRGLQDKVINKGTQLVESPAYRQKAAH